MKQTFKKVYTVSKKAEKPRLFLQHIVCEAAGLQPGEELYISINDANKEIILQNFPFDNNELDIVHVASRVSKVSGGRRPLVDTSGDKYQSIINVKQQVEISVYRKEDKSKIIVRPLHYRLFENSSIPTQRDERIRLLSICAGSGIGTAALTDTKYFTPVQEIELEDDSVSVLQHNFENSYIFNGDLRHCMDVAEADVALVTAPCNEFSTLGELNQNVMDDLLIATAKIIQSSKASVLFFENVPGFFKSQAWFNLKQLLIDDYPYWAQKEIEAWDFGSIATRKRVYAVGFDNEERFLEFQFPIPPKMRRKKLKDFLDPSQTQHEWKSVDEWMESFKSRLAWKDRSLDLTFVTGAAERISCLPKRYASHSASSSYVLSEDKRSWRFLSISEIRRILGVPEWYEFCSHIPILRRYEMLGQSLDCKVIKAIGNRIAYAFMKTKKIALTSVQKIKQGINVNGSGQLEFSI